MFLGAYHFEGDPAELLEAHDRVMTGLPAEEVELHICVATDHGITVLDACPNQETFEAFSTSAEFLGAVRAVGLAPPRVEALGEVLQVRVGESVGR